MKQLIFLCFCCLVLSSEILAGTGQPVNNGPVSLNAGNLAANKARIRAQDPQIMAAYKQLIKDADKGLKFGPVSVMEKQNQPPSGDKHDYMSLAPYFWPDPSKPNGLPYIRKDGETNPEVKDYKDKEYMPKLCEVVYDLALAYYFSDDKMYAAHAALLLRVWFLDTATRMNPNLNYGQAIKGNNDGRGSGLIDTRHFIKIIDAEALLQGSAWKTADHKALQKWFADFLTWMQTSKNGQDEMKAGNNHGVWYDAQRLAMALFIDSMNLAKKIVVNAEMRLDKQQDEAGNFPKELERTTSLHYTVFAVSAFYKIAQMSDKTGIDFWHYTSPSGKSLQKAFEILKPYITNAKPWTGQQIKEYETEESYLLLAEANRFGCKTCLTEITRLAGDTAPKLDIHLLYNY